MHDFPFNYLANVNLGGFLSARLTLLHPPTVLTMKGGFFAFHLLKMTNGKHLPLCHIFPVEISNNLTPHFRYNTLHLALLAGKSPTSLYYVIILGLSYLHVKFHHAEGIFTTYIDHFTFPPNYVRPVISSISL